MFSHEELVMIAAKYATNQMNCGAVFKEHKCATTREIVDVAAYRAGVMINIEAKATRSDFLKDKTKPHRKDPSRGVGHYRFYIAPKGLISVDELPERWGLLEVTNNATVKQTHVPSLIRCLVHKSAYLKRNDGLLNKKEKDTIEFFFDQCNEKGHMDYLYSAYRQLVMASQAGEVINVNEVFEKPEILKGSCNVVKFNNH
ncbi:hypothetical protein Kuja_1300 [Vibrio phage vB_VchM_Kuja]|uniref:Uncharacterized protein n=1 Tax=Vibrio phage vB_VchM_Kuja TaxID=2686437 RepID=A0A6B9J5G4_9CAUD|nr:hypothetical protein HWC83_gp106 [Vibrio phage vB_VchM_Kuja]QGZ16121.1 hypothetical protein Kuja_1300 [Vibrio phage vB_VchM_Kuja]